MLARVDALSADIEVLEDRIEQMLAPSLTRRPAWTPSPASAPDTAAIIIAEIGLDMSRFPTRASGVLGQVHPQRQAVRQPNQGQRRHRPRQPIPGPRAGPGAVGASRTDRGLGARYRRIARRRGKKKAVVAVGRSILIVCWHLLADPDARYTDLGAHHYKQHATTARQRRNHIRQLEHSATRSPSNPPRRPWSPFAAAPWPRPIFGLARRGWRREMW